MKKLILFFALLLLLGSWGCKKETTPIVPPVTEAPVYKVKTIVHNLGIIGYTDTFRYDATGRLISRTTSDGFTHSFSYTTTLAVDSYYNASGSLLGTETYFLNANQRADSLKKIYFGTTTYLKYTYDSEGHLTVQKSLDDTHAVVSIDNFIWENGNNTEVYRTSSTSQFISHTVNYYDDTHKNTIGNQNTGRNFFGVDSKNSVVSQYYTSTSSTLSIYNFVNTYDAQERMAQFIIYNNSGSINSSGVYTYY